MRSRSIILFPWILSHHKHPPPLSNYFSELAFFDPFFTTITLHGM